jgi:CheY-like chemotaxis protein
VHIALRGDEVSHIDRLIRPDVVILDINMPGMSCYAVAREIRERRQVRNVVRLATLSVTELGGGRPNY